SECSLQTSLLPFLTSLSSLCSKNEDARKYEIETMNASMYQNSRKRFVNLQQCFSLPYKLHCFPWHEAASLQCAVSLTNNQDNRKRPLDNDPINITLELICS
ncbi:hypothetical protein J4Q44_G00311370, partial [Coregonus suidteri]